MYAGGLLVLAARACADLAERARARRDKHGQLNAQAALSRLEELADGMGGVPFTENLLGARIPADRAGWDAERGRANGDNDPALWQRAAAAWDDLGRPHATAYARWRQAEACLARDPGGPDVPELVRGRHRGRGWGGATARRHSRPDKASQDPDRPGDPEPVVPDADTARAAVGTVRPHRP